MRALKFPCIALNFYSSSSGVAHAATVSNTSSAMVTTQFNNSVFASINPRFVPFTIGRYTFSSEYSPSEDFPALLTGHDLLNDARRFLMTVDDFSVPVRVGQRLSYHTGMRGEVEVSFLFLMEGGRPFTYYTANDVITIWRRAVQQRPNLDAHPTDVTISEGGYAKIRCTITKLTDWRQIRITTGAPLYLGAYAWPSRRVDARGTRNILDGIKDVIVRYSKPSELLPEWWGVEEVRRNLILRLDFPTSPPRPQPPIKNEDLYELVDEIENFLNQQPSYCELYGSLIWDTPGTTPEEVGYFNLAYVPDNARPLAANSTQTAMGADVSSIR